MGAWSSEQIPAVQRQGSLTNVMSKLSLRRMKEFSRQKRGERTLCRRALKGKAVEDEGARFPGGMWNRGSVSALGVEGQQRATVEERLGPEFSLARHLGELALCP